MTQWYKLNRAPRNGERVFLRLAAISVDTGCYQRVFERDVVTGSFDYEWTELTGIQYWNLNEKYFRWNEDYFDAWAPIPDLEQIPVDFVSE